MKTDDQHTTAHPAIPDLNGWTDAQGYWHQESGRFTLRSCSDEALARLAREIRRGEEDDTGAPAPFKEAVHREQLGRFSLRMRYGAVDDHLGTHSYDHSYRLGEPPTYTLAACMDRCRWELGQQHVLDWANGADSGDAQQGRR